MNIFRDDIEQAEADAKVSSERVIGEWVDEDCSRLWREVAALKKAGKDTEKGGEYDAKLTELRQACRARLEAVGLERQAL